MIYLDATDKLKSRRKDYRRFHRKFIAFLREEHSFKNDMTRFFRREKYKTHQEMADILGVSRKTISRHCNDITYSDWVTLTGLYAFKRKPKPDDLTAPPNGIMRQGSELFKKFQAAQREY